MAKQSAATPPIPRLAIPILMLAVYIPLAPLIQSWALKLMSGGPVRAKQS